MDISHFSKQEHLESMAWVLILVFLLKVKALILFLLVFLLSQNLLVLLTPLPLILLVALGQFILELL